jgi:hypothetical protein
MNLFQILNLYFGANGSGILGLHIPAFHPKTLPKSKGFSFQSGLGSICIE